MKTIFSISSVIFILISNLSNAQSPLAIPYQAIARDNAGEPILNQNISLRFSIRDENITGVIIYQETHNLVTNNLGLFNLNIGQGTVASGSFASIKWGSNDKFLQVELDPAGGTNFSSMGTQQLLSVPYSLHAGTSENILDSLVLRDSTGDVRMVLNPNTGTFKMMNNDTVWYSIEVNSPPNTVKNLGNGVVQETKTVGNTTTFVTKVESTGKLIKTSTFVKPETTGDPSIHSVTEYNENGIITFRSYSESYPYGGGEPNYNEYYYDENGNLVRHLFSLYKNTSLAKKDTIFDPATGKPTKIEVSSYGPYAESIIIETYDGNGNLIGKREENHRNGTTRYFKVSTDQETNLEAGKISVEKPEAKTEVAEGIITFTVDTSLYQQGIDPVTKEPYLSTADTSGNENYRVTLKYNDIYTNAPKFTLQPSLSSIHLDLSTSFPKIIFDYWDPTPGLYRPGSLYWTDDDDDELLILDAADPSSNDPLGFALDPDEETVFGSAKKFNFRLDYTDPIGSSVELDLENDLPKITLDYWNSAGTTHHGLFDIYPYNTNGEFICSAYDPLSTNSVGIRFVPSSSYFEFDGELRSTSPLNFGNGGSIYIGSSSLFVGSSVLSLTSGLSVFSVTPTLSTWTGTLSCSSFNGSNSIYLQNSGVYLSSGLSSFSVQPSFITSSATTILSSPNGSSSLYIDNSSINISSGTSLFSVTSSLSSWAGTLSLSSANSSSLFYIDNSGLTLTSGLNSFAVTPTSGTWTGTLSCSSANGGSVFLTNNSGISFSSGTNSFAVTPTTGTWSGTLSCSSGNGGSVFLVENSGLSLTSGLSSLSVTSSGLSTSGTLTAGGQVTVTSPSGISITNGGLTASGTVSANSFSGNGGSITLISASNISTGTLSDGRLSSNIPKLNQFNNFTAPIFVAATPGQDAITGIASGMVPGPPSNLAGKFYGNVNITGNLTKGSGTFKIDHPLDPLNKYLYHSFVESPDMMNIYTGSIILNEEGKATVDLPEWFESLNKNFHYQLTCVGGFSQVFISKEIDGNKFEISGGKKDMKVSWQVTGTRKDAYAEKFRIQVEEEKPVGEKGTYLHPDAFVNE